MKMILASLVILVLAACAGACKCPELCGCDCPGHPKAATVSPEKR